MVVRKKKGGKKVELPSDPEQLEAALELFSDGETVDKGTQILTAFLKEPACVTAMVQQIAESSNDSVRQLAAVLLRLRILNHWKIQSKQVKDLVRETLLERLAQEPFKPARVAVACLVTTIARPDLQRHEWDDLMPNLWKLVQSGKDEVIDVALLIMKNLVETCKNQLESELPAMQEFFETQAMSSNKTVRRRALQALNTVYGMYDEEEGEAKFAHAADAILQLLGKLIDEDDEDSITIVFEIISIMVDADVLDAQMASLIPSLLEYIRHPEASANLRDQAMYAITQTIQRKPLRITSNDLMQPIFETLFALLCEEHDDCFDADEISPQRIAVEALEDAFKYLPRKVIFPTCLEAARHFLNDKSEYVRKGGVVLLAMMSEGCASELADDENGQTYKDLVAHLSSLLLQETDLVRTAVCVFFCQAATYLPDDSAEYHEMIIPALLQVLNSNPSVMVQKKAYRALDTVCENFGISIAPYVNDIMAQLHQHIESDDETVQLNTITAIRSVALAAKERFLEFLNPVAEFLKPLLANPPEGENYPEHTINLRIRATECLGAMYNAVGTANWTEDVPEVINHVLDGLDHVDDFELREASHYFMGHVIEALKGDTPAEMVLREITFIIGTLNNDDGLEIDEDDEDFAQIALDDEEDAEEEAKRDEEDEDDEYDGLDPRKISYNSFALEEKRAALVTLGKIAMSVPRDMFVPFVDKVMEAINSISSFPSDLVRHSAIAGYSSLLSFFAKHYPNPAGVAVGQSNSLNNEAEPVLMQISKQLCERIREDTDADTVARALEAFGNGLTYFGQAFIPSGEDEKEFYESLMTLAAERGGSQVDEEEKDIGSAHYELVLDALCDLLGTLAKIRGAAFTEVFDHLIETVNAYVNPGRPDSFRGYAVGCIGEVVEYTYPDSAKYADFLLEQSLTYLRDTAVDVRRNAAYLVGELARCNPKATSREAKSMLPLLMKLYEEMVESKGDTVQCLGAKDNVVSCVGKFISNIPDAIDMEEMVPFFVQGLPLTGDVIESKNVYPVLCDLWANHHEMMLKSFFEKTIHIVADVLPQEAISDEIRGMVQELGKSLASAYPDQLRGVLQGMSQQQVDVLKQGGVI